MVQTVVLPVKAAIERISGVLAAKVLLLRCLSNVLMRGVDKDIVNGSICKSTTQSTHSQVSSPVAASAHAPLRRHNALKPWLC